MFDTTSSLPQRSEIFAQVIHPGEPLIAIGLSNGHVSTIRLPPPDDDDGASAHPAKKRRGSDGTDYIKDGWDTRRHKGSCRCLAYNLDGRTLYSAGSDGIVKAAESETGRVTGKIVVPSPADAVGPLQDNAPSIIHALSPQTFILGTDAGILHLYDLRDPAPSSTTVSGSNGTKTAFLSSKPVQTYDPKHADSILSLTPLPASSTSTSGYSKQWLSTGGGTLALTDLRRGVLSTSEFEGTDLMSSLYTTTFPTSKKKKTGGEKALVGNNQGQLLLYNRNEWEIPDERITVSPTKETLDAMAFVPDHLGSGGGKRIAIGLGDGKIRIFSLGQRRVIAEVQHDELDGVMALGFDVGGRMVSAGGQVVKVWRESIGGEDAEDEDDDGVEDDVASFGARKRLAEGSDGEDVDSEEEDEAAEADSSDEELAPKKRRKKRKKGKKGAANGGSGVSFAGLD